MPPVARRLPEALSELEEALRASPVDEQGRRRRQEAEMEFRRAAYRKVLGPLLQGATEVKNPVRAAMQLQLGLLLEVALNRFPAVLAESLRRDSGDELPWPRQELETLLALSRQITNDAKEVQRWRKQNSSRRTSRPPRLPPGGRWNDWDLGSEN